MSFFSKLKGIFSDPNELKQYQSKLFIGITEDQEPVCPNCSHKLPKRPGKKSKCKQCGEFIIVRTRPSDNKKVLLTEAQARLIDDEMFKTRDYDGFMKNQQEKDLTYSELKERFGREPSKNDVQWHILNKRYLEGVRVNGICGGRNERYDMAIIANEDGKLETALGLLIEVAYCDAITLIAHYEQNSSVRQYSEKPDLTNIAGAVIHHISVISQELEMPNELLKSKVTSVMNDYNKKWKIPADVNKIWDMIEEYIKQAKQV